MKMPVPIAIRLFKLILSVAVITILGTLIALISHDHTLLILSGSIAIAGSIKACVFYRQVIGQQYECLEGTLLKEQVSISRKRHTIVLLLEDGTMVQRVLDGNYKLKEGTAYRFYLKNMPGELPLLPNIYQPASIVFGHEEIILPSGRQI